VPNSTENQNVTLSDRIAASYERERANYDRFAAGGVQHELTRKWFDPGTVDAWRHQRMYATLDPLLDHSRGAKWLTIGDGRCGSDANYLLSKGADALASDLCDTLLVEAKRCGFIQVFESQNAEQLTFDDESFDYVLCKESYHHFPRPMIALYEMLRVARLGVVLIEPFDRFYRSPAPEQLWNFLKSIPKRMGRSHKNVSPFRFEPAGNFIYTIHPREMQKVAMALDLPTCAFCGMNDVYLPGVEDAPASLGDALFERIKREVCRLDRLCRLRIRQPNILTSVLMKTPPDKTLADQLEKSGFNIVTLPTNPYRTT